MPAGKRARRSAPRGDVRSRVMALARNLWWTWNGAPQRLFASIDPDHWEASRHRITQMLAVIPEYKLDELAGEPAFQAALAECERSLNEYLTTRPWFERNRRRAAGNMQVAYFSAEFALHESMPQYSGGLGVLAGDHLKSASDLGVPLVGVGLAYRCGYYRQQLRSDGTTRVAYPRFDFRTWPLLDTGKTVSVELGRTTLHARVWRAQVGRVPLLLLDSDVPRNPPRLREVTAHLYGGDIETRIQQEILLGIGGVRALAALGPRPTVYHLNEGHAAFATLERLRSLVAAGRSLDEARKRVRASTVFTTHTPVPAGHDRFPTAQMTRYFGPLMRRLGLGREAFMGLGRETPSDRSEPFCMTVLALRLSQRCNGVARLHGEVSRTMWMKVYGVQSPDRVPIGHITNGVHSQTWLAPEIEPLYARYLRPRWLGAGPRDDCWKNAARIPAAELWRIRGALRSRLVQFIRNRLRAQIERRLGGADELIAAYETFDERALTIGFARRFATYKRAPLVFHNARRLAAILGRPDQPVQLVFSGKAHPRDLAGQAFCQEIFKHTRQSPFRGRVAFLEEYDLEVGRMLTSGCDVWLNNPLRPQEASGTSGMKPPLHGGLNCSILDGWWPEGYNGRNGWAIGDGREFADRRRQDRHDADAIYDLLEKEIVPLFYQRGADGVPHGWVQRMIESMRSVCGAFNTHRMVGQYVTEYYEPSHRESTRR